MGKRSDFERRELDAYDTPSKAIEPLLIHLGRNPVVFIEPCAGKGDMVDFLKENGHICIDAFDIEPRRDDIRQINCFDYPVQAYNDCEYIITNPPWKKPELFTFIELWASIKPTWLLLDVNWVFSKRAGLVMREYCQKIVAMPRVKWIEGSQHTGTENCAWFLFDKDYEGPIEIVPQP